MDTRSAAVFSELDERQVGRILSVLGGGAGADSLHERRVETLRRLGLGPRQARDAVGWFHDMCIGTMNPGLAMRMLEGMDADDKAKRLAIGMFRSLVDARRRGAISGAPPLHDNAANTEPFHRFVSLHKDDPEFMDKYVAFVHGKFQKCGPSDSELIREMREKFGNVPMCVGKVTAKPRTYRIDSPELV